MGAAECAPPIGQRINSTLTAATPRAARSAEPFVGPILCCSPTITDSLSITVREFIIVSHQYVWKPAQCRRSWKTAACPQVPGRAAAAMFYSLIAQCAQFTNQITPAPKLLVVFAFISLAGSLGGKAGPLQVPASRGASERGANVARALIAGEHIATFAASTETLTHSPSWPLH